MVGGGKKISAVSARARTRRNKARSSSFPLFPGWYSYSDIDLHFVTDMFTKAVIVLLISLLVWTYQTIIQPPPPNICGLPGGPPVTSPRIKLSDGRYLAYRERGVAKEKSEFKIIMVHGFDNSKDMALVASQELILELRIYFLSFDRAGYGESDPNPNRSVKSDTFDIQELADKLQLGSNFYVASRCSSCGSNCQLLVAFLSLSSIQGGLQETTSARPMETSDSPLRSWTAILVDEPEMVPVIFLCGDSAGSIWQYRQTNLEDDTVIRQQGVFESLHRDLMVGFGSWDFDPMELSNPFPHNESFVHIWQGFEDPLVPVKLQQYVCRKLQWIRYHEVTDGGHLIMYDTNLFEAILRELLLPSGLRVLRQVYPKITRNPLEALKQPSKPRLNSGYPHSSAWTNPSPKIGTHDVSFLLPAAAETPLAIST
ncbi:hypothetical protein NC651_023209 [Populus alba x Populus x berolinensis]|nr:hypothetical protein NC651_023209 [Populus alba x Populus x berolinensis]